MRHTWRKRAPIPSLLIGAMLLAVSPGGPLRAGPEEEEKGAGKKGGAAKDAPGKGEEEAKGSDLEAWGVVKDVKGTPFLSLTYTKVEGRKARKATVFVKPAEDAEYFRDRIIPVTDLKEGDAIWVFGRPVEHQVADKTGARGIDYQLQNVTAIAAGAGIRVDTKHKDPRDPKALWSKAEIAKAGPSILVTCDGAEYKVILGRQAPILLREKVEPIAIKSGAHLELSCDRSEERPETKSAADAKKESYVAKRIVLLDRRLVPSLYPMLLE